MAHFVTIEVRSGPVLRSACDVLDMVPELIRLIPEWHAREREELASRAQGLTETIYAELKKPK